MVLGGLFPSTPLVNVFVIVVATGLIWIGSGWLEESAELLSEYYGLPPVIQGSLVVAIGSSFPEFSSVVFTALAGVFDMGVGAIVGSAIFNVLVIPAIAGLATDETLETNRSLVYKEAQFYMIAVSALIVTFALAVIYLPVSGRDLLIGELTRPLALIPIGLYLLYLFIQWQDVEDYTPESAPPEISLLRQWGKLLGGLLIILVTVEQLVGAVESLGQTFGIPEFFAGVIIIAGVTSLPDTIVSVRAAREGRGVTSLGNVLGSNTFDLLAAIPVGVLIVGAVEVNFSVAAPMMGVLTLATMLLFAILRTDLVVTQLESYLLLVAYALFVCWMIAETVGITSIIAGA